MFIGCIKDIELIPEEGSGREKLEWRSNTSCLDQVSDSLINVEHRGVLLMLYHDALRYSPQLNQYGDPEWRAVLSEEDSEINSVVPLITVDSSGHRIKSLLFLNSSQDHHELVFFPVPDSIPDPVHPDSFDLRLVLELCHCYLWCESDLLQYRDGTEPDCYDFSKRSKKKKFRRDFEEEEGSGYGGTVTVRYGTIIYFGGYGNYNWLFGGNQNAGGGGGSSVFSTFQTTLIDLWADYYDCLSSSPELAQAVIQKQFKYQGALQIINQVLDEVLEFMCADLAGPYLNLENFNNQFEYVIQSYPFLQLYERLGFDHEQNDILFCLEFAPDEIDFMLGALDNGTIQHPCDPSLSPQSMLYDALLTACAQGPYLTRENLVANLPEAVIEKLMIGHFVNDRIQHDPGGEEVYLAFESSFNSMNCLEPELKAIRAIELFERLELDPDFLLGECFSDPDYPYSFWSDLASFTPSQEIINKIGNSGYSIQRLQDASAPKVNLDFYFIAIQEMPKINGIEMTIPELVSHFRININNYTSFNGIGSSQFNPIPNDEILWQSYDPFSSILEISIPIDPGHVVCSDFHSCCWTFSTIEGPWPDPGTHPVSGNRQLGIAENGGNPYFFIKGTDRSTTWLDAIASPLQYFVADNLWINTIQNFNEFIVAHGGLTWVGAPQQIRQNWNRIKSILQSEDSIQSLPCD